MARRARALPPDMMVWRMADRVTVQGRSGAQVRPARSGLMLVFDRGARPDRTAVATALAAIPRVAISHDPATLAGPTHAASPLAAPEDMTRWLELLVDGLTVDLVGLAPGPALDEPDVAYRYNCEIGEPGGREAVGLFPGPHIAAGASSMPILRTLLGLGADLADTLDGLRAVCWGPARSAIAPQFFVRTIRTWLDDGPFPALGLLGLHFDEGGTLTSEGLAFFTGYELAVDPALTADRAAAMRLTVRVVHELVGAELPEVRHEFVTDEGLPLALEPDPSARLIRIGPL